MAIVAIDNNKIKTRIKNILEVAGSFFDKDSPKGKVRQILVGTPPNKDYKDLTHPALVITNSERWMEETNRGPVVANKKTSVATTVRYDLILTVQMEDSNAAEKEVDRLWILLEQRLYDFATLRKPSDDTDPLCKDILFTPIRRIPQFQGQEIDGFRATLEVLIDPHD